MHVTSTLPGWAMQYMGRQSPLPGGRGSGAKSSGRKRFSSWQIRRRLRPGTTSARMARSVRTSFGIISRSAVARRHGNSMYLHHSRQSAVSAMSPKSSRAQYSLLLLLLVAANSMLSFTRSFGGYILLTPSQYQLRHLVRSSPCSHFGLSPQFCGCDNSSNSKLHTARYPPFLCANIFHPQTHISCPDGLAADCHLVIETHSRRGAPSRGLDEPVRVKRMLLSDGMLSRLS